MCCCVACSDTCVSFKLLHDGARQIMPLSKSIWDLDTWGPAVTWVSPFQVEKSKNNPFSSQIFSCLEEATATTTTQAPSTCHAEKATQGDLFF